MADRRVLRVTLRYTDIDSLFDTPDVSPFSEDFHEYSTLPGIEHIYGELQANPSLKRVRRPSCSRRADHAEPGAEDSKGHPTILSRPQSGGGAERARAQMEGAARARDRARTLRRLRILAMEIAEQRHPGAQQRILEGLDILIWVAFGFRSMPYSSACNHTTLTPRATSAPRRCN